MSVNMNRPRMLSCIAMMLIICGITLGLETPEDVGLGLSEKVNNRSITEIGLELEDPPNSGITGSFKKPQKVKKRPGVSAVYFGMNTPIEPYIEDMNSANVSESSVIDKTALNILRSSYNSSLLKSYKAEEKIVKMKDLISSDNLSPNSANAPIMKVDSEESSSKASLGRSSIEGNSFELKESTVESKVYNESKFIAKDVPSKMALKISKEDNNSSLTKNEMMFSGDETELSNSDSTGNSTTLSHSPMPFIPGGNSTNNFTTNVINFTSTPKTLKVMSKPSTATMGEIGKMSSGNVVLISSIIAIICLCALIGVIAYKRIYAYWYRRHYSRVDFLIDGLYEM